MQTRVPICLLPPNFSEPTPRPASLTGVETEKTLQTRVPIDAADIEHIAALTTGGLLFLTGIRKGGFLGFLFRVGGAALIWRGQHGYRRLSNALGVPMPDTLTGTTRHAPRIDASVTIDRPRQELYRIWRHLENLPVFMTHLVKVVELSDTRSRWVAQGPAGTVVTWDAKIIRDEENEVIAWSTYEGSGVDTAGSVHFEDSANGTRIRVRLRYDPPADLLGAFLARLLGNDPQRQIQHDLARFKQIMEVGSQIAAERDRPKPKAEMI